MYRVAGAMAQCVSMVVESPALILSAESVVGMEWKGMSTSIATRAACPGLSS